jgi:PhzF family phenazine biosynthesis protein
MNTLQLFQVDAFASELFAGNPAAVCILEEWLPEATMQAISAENNLAETAFAVPVEGGYGIRWFTPETEVALCGHATLATAFILFRDRESTSDSIRFESRERGLLEVRRTGDWLVLDFPADKLERIDIPKGIIDALGTEPLSCFKGETDYMVVFGSEEEVRLLQPNFHLLDQIPARGVIATSQGEECDFVSRFFAPRCGIPEDPVTGSAHTTLTPYWSEKLKKTRMQAAQLSPRGGHLRCELKGDRVLIGGRAVLYMEAEIYLPKT